MSRKQHTTRRLLRTAMFSAVQGCAAAAGSAAITAMLSWLEHR